MRDLRQTVRHRTFLRGRVIFDNGGTTFDCIIRDLNEQGARVVFSTTVNVPDLVELCIPEKDETLRARVVRRNNYEIGLAFCVPGKAEAESRKDRDFASRLTRLEDEVALLRRLLRKATNKINAG